MSKAEYAIIAILTVALVTVSGVSYYLITDDEPDRNAESVTRDSMGSVLEIICTSGNNESRGTGFVTSHNNRNVVVSNAHVILMNDVVSDKIVARFYNSSFEYEMNVISFDVDKDISLLEFHDIIPLKPLKLGDSGTVRYSQEVITIGNALGFGLSSYSGIVSVPQVNINSGGEERPFVQTNININRGNSGGPLLDMNGDVVGMISFRLNTVLGSVQGMSFAIPSNMIFEYIESEI